MRIAILCTAVLLAACGTQHAAQVQSPPAPTVLQLQDVQEGGGSGAQLEGHLPMTHPDTAAVYDLGMPDAAVVDKLAAALHAGTVTRSGSTYRAGNLIVTGSAWSWSPCGADAVTSSTGATSCAVAPPVRQPGGSAATQPQADDAAKAVFTALGLDLSAATVKDGSVSLDPTVDGQRVIGLTTQLEVGSYRSITYGSGWLGSPRAGESYPVLDARKVFDDLPTVAVPEVCLPLKGGGCATIAPAVVTGAHLGLSRQTLASGGTALVPSWLFDVSGSSTPLVGIAVAHTSRSKGYDQTNPVVPLPATVSPAPPLGAAHGLPIESASTSGTTLTVRYAGGGCGYKDLTKDVAQTSMAVTVTLTATPIVTAGLACPAVARLIPLDLTLTAPLGDRALIDGTTGSQVPVT